MLHKITPRLNQLLARGLNFVRPLHVKTLAAFYDLNEFPASYDMVFWAVAAQSRALKLRLSGVHIYLVNGRHQGLRLEEPDYEVAYPMAQRNYVVSQVLETLPRLARLCGRTAPRIEPQEMRRTTAMYPAYYALHMENQWNPLHRVRREAHAAWRELGDRLAFSASEGARSLMTDWLKSQGISGKPMVLTMRDRKWSHGRNSDGGGWREFLNILRERGIPTVVIPDTERVFERADFGEYGVPACIPASVNTELRLALCELARMNFTVNTGPGTMLLFSKAPYRYFTNLDTSKESSTALWEEIGLPPGTQLATDTNRQRLIWEPDSLENLLRELDGLPSELDESLTSRTS